MNAMKRLILIWLILIPGIFRVFGQEQVNGKYINITKLKAYEKNKLLTVEWMADAGDACNYWEVQGSADGKDFHTVALVLGPDSGKKGEQYLFKGKITRPDDLYYRVVHISLTGTNHQKSEMIQLEKSGANTAVTRKY